MEVKDVKRSLGKTVAHTPSGVAYRFTAYIFRQEKGRYLHQAELQDLSALRSVRICRLEDVAAVAEEEADEQKNRPEEAAYQE